MSSARLRTSPLRLAAVVVLLCLVAAACGSDDEQQTTTDTDDSTETADPSDSSTDPDTDTGSDPGVSGAAVDLALFFDGALDSEPTEVDCTLSDGTESTCLEITVAGFPAEGDIGPFCPRTTSDTAEEVGIWFDGENLYDIDGEFILGLADTYGDDTWQLFDEDGNVFVTDSVEAFEAAARPDVDPEYQNHCVEGLIEYLEGEEPITTTVTIPATPVAADSSTAVNAVVGVTLNGVRIDGPAPVDAILGAYTIAAFDDCGGHVNPAEGYHVHGATGCSEVGEAADGETRQFAYALDGFAIHSPYENDADEAAAGLDDCNGHTTDELGYHYHANPAVENAVLSCFSGLTTQSDAAAGGPPGGGPPGGDGPPG